LIKFSSNWQNS